MAEGGQWSRTSGERRKGGRDEAGLFRPWPMG